MSVRPPPSSRIHRSVLAASLPTPRGGGLAPARPGLFHQKPRLPSLRIKGPLSANQVLQAAKDLLCDGVTQEHRVVSASPVQLNGMNFWRVEVWLKPTVTDSVGETVSAAISEMGLPRPDAVRCAVVYRLAGRSTKAQIEKAVSKSLANPLIHRFLVSEAHP